MIELAGDRIRLADLLRLQTLALQHVEEVGVAAEVQLIRAIQAHAAIFKQARQHAMRDRRADLALDVVADDGQPGFFKAALPVFLAGDEHRNAVDERAARAQNLLHVPLGGFLAADRQIRHHHVRLGVLQQLHDVVRGAGRFRDDLRQILAQTIVRHAARHGHIQLGHVGKLVRVVLPGEDRLAQILAHLLHVDVDRRAELHIADVIAAQRGVHDARNLGAFGGILVILHALHQRRRAVADADNGDTHFLGFLTDCLSHDVAPCVDFEIRYVKLRQTDEITKLLLLQQDRVPIERAEHFPARSADLDEAGRFQAPQMPRHQRLAFVQRLGQFVDRAFALRQRAEHLQPHHVFQRVKRAGQFAQGSGFFLD